VEPADSGTDWVAIIGLGVALGALLLSLYNARVERRRNRPHVGIYFALISRNTWRISIVNLGPRAVYLTFTGTSHQIPGGSDVRIAFDLLSDGDQPEPLQPLQPLVYSRPVEDLRNDRIVEVQTSDRATYTEPIPHWMLGEEPRPARAN
jgi:hypothetical protein